VLRSIIVNCKKNIVGAKQKKIYEITASGREVLQTWLAEEVEAYPQRNELLLKIVFGHNVPVEVSLLCTTVMPTYVITTQRETP